jgi:uncharacterized protein YbjQ (UPF0145 family)
MHWLDLLNIALPLLLVLVGYFAGQALERRHYASIRRRERELQSVLAFSTRYVPDGVAATNGRLVSGSVVVSSDYFKTFVAGFRNLLGGRFRGYETLLERARREAMLRLKAEAQRQGSRLVIGVRFHTTRVAGSATPSVEVLAYGTALNCSVPTQP